MKQGPEKTQLVKEPKEKTEKYLFQNNKKTKLGLLIVVVFLISLVLGIVVSKFFFSN
ncbi:MAG: hypothetical protein WA810_03790 [Maribacter sp.]